MGSQPRLGRKCYQPDMLCLFLLYSSVSETGQRLFYQVCLSKFIPSKRSQYIWRLYVENRWLRRLIYQWYIQISKNSYVDHRWFSKYQCVSVFLDPSLWLRVNTLLHSDRLHPKLTMDHYRKQRVQIKKQYPTLFVTCIPLRMGCQRSWLLLH